MGIIRECKISLIIFSENYADSRWCLQELVEIMERKRMFTQLAFPIFYHVDPSDVRNQTGSFGKAFEKLEAGLSTELRDKIPEWKAVLKEAGNLAGVHITNMYETEVISSIVDEVCRRITGTYMNLAVYPVGIDSRVEEISNSLYVGVGDDVRMVGIWGMGGIGKTTLAKAIYNKFYLHFDSKSFLADVRETAKNSRGKISLQERLLFDVLKPTKIEVGDVSTGVNIIRERLGRKKVLIIVDDVDHEDQLQALAISHNSFGPGSRIVITTRDQHLLELLNVNTTYLTRRMSEEEALLLFSVHAFQKQHPDENFIDISKRVVTYCGGLPLALEVLGSLLFKREVSHWESALEKLEKIPDARIQSTLRISYDTMDESQKSIFLHICCFFIGVDKSYIMEILEGCGFSPAMDIGVLQQRCLITFNKKNKLMMHDLLRDMGREVVREESPNIPEKRSRLWRPEEVIDLLTDRSGTDVTEGLALNSQTSESSDNMITVATKTFGKMKRLKLLQLNYVKLRGKFNKFPKKLSWLCLRGYPENSIQIKLLNIRLVYIDMRYSKLELFSHISWNRLKILNLSHSHYLRQSPDFSQVPFLQYLILKDCVRLSEIDSSIGCLNELSVLNLKGSTMLKNLPDDFYELKSVRTLVLSGCSSFEQLSRHIGYMTLLETLLISGTAISEVPSTVDKLPELKLSSRQGLSGLPRV